jgi:hypothetical protein
MAIDKPSDKEDEFFMKMEAEKLKKLRGHLDKKRDEDSKNMRKESHWMKCPKCGADLEEINYQNVMIDRCTECLGIWLDHGELELLAQAGAKLTTGFIDRLFGKKK